MKTFITIVIAALSLNAFGQGTSQLPWNPDENGDGVIGVSDLQGLLSQYGQEFSAAVLSENGENAVVNMGDMQYPVCASTCKNLPGFWSVASLEDLGLVWSTVSGYTWLKRVDSSPFPGILGGSDTIYQQLYAAGATCYCATHERPKVEYSIIATGADITTRRELVSEAALEGWRLMPDADGYGYSTMWRWAE